MTFTQNDVALGDTITVRHEWTTGGGMERTTRDLTGEVVEVKDTSVRVSHDGHSRWVYLYADDRKVTILDVQKPKPVYEVGGLYEITDGDGGRALRRRVEGGWGYVSDVVKDTSRMAQADLLAITDEYAERHEWAARRMLIVEYPDGVQR